MAKLQYAAVLVWAAAAALVASSHLACRAQDTGGTAAAAAAAAAAAVCRPSSCGDIPNVSKPFRLRGDPRDCGDYELECVANRTILELPYSNRRFWVKAIWYEDMVIQVIDARAIAAGPSFLLSPGAGSEIFIFDDQRRFADTGSSAVVLINCSSPVERHPAVVEASSCMTTNSSRSRVAAGNGTHLYWLEGDWTRGQEWEPNGLPHGCRRVGTVQYGSYSSTRTWLASCSEVRDALMQGFNLTWNVHNHDPQGFWFSSVDPYNLTWNDFRCFFYTVWYQFGGTAIKVITAVLTVRTSIGYVALLAFLVYKIRRRLLGMHDFLSYSSKHMRIYFLVGIAWLLIIVRTSIGYIALLAFVVYKLWRRLLGMQDDVDFLRFYSDHSHMMSSIRCFFCTIWYGYIYKWPWMTYNFLSYSNKHMRIYFLVGIAWLLIIVRMSIGYIALLAFLVYKLWRRLLGMNDGVEMFLVEYKNCMPTRYTYRQIRKMTGNFKEKLGQGGFGSVFRGKQPTGRPVAIKILSKSDSNGQDFINEVATIGRIHHANVVQLVGFCVEGSKKALVYEFMPQGSLDRYIYENKEGSTATNSSSSTSPLSWAKTLEVAIGIARGIEYLHRGCSMKILHFDIKPQNVLLDTNFNPKISDFGLAKSYPTEKNTVTVTAVRGTFGYMAPELFYASAGGVSSKSDVYSFGMLLMEMAGRRKNVHPDHAGNISNEGYLPTWTYNQLEQGKDISVGGSNDEEKNIIYKLFMVALWCVQMKPVDRPSMGKVIEMLEGSAQQLQMPAGKPFLCSITDHVSFEDLVTTGSDSSEISIVMSPLASAQHADQ